MKNIFKAFISGLSPKEKKILYIAGGLIFLAVFDRMVIAPISQEARITEDEIDANIALIKKDLLILQYKNKIMADDKDHGFFYVKEDLVQEESIALLLSEVEEIAKKSQIVLTNVNRGAVEEKKDYVQYSLLIECEGKMNNIIDFIYNIDSAQKPIRVYSYEITPQKREDYTVRCMISVYKIIVAPVNRADKEKS
ncbi:MAG: type 4a pilus biogenesis protein PilO [Candidatus Omnitrophota bacterium]